MYFRVAVHLFPHVRHHKIRQKEKKKKGKAKKASTKETLNWMGLDKWHLALQRKRMNQHSPLLSFLDYDVNLWGCVGLCTWSSIFPLFLQVITMFWMVRSAGLQMVLMLMSWSSMPRQILQRWHMGYLPSWSKRYVCSLQGKTFYIAMLCLVCHCQF